MTKKGERVKCAVCRKTRPHFHCCSKCTGHYVGDKELDR